MSTGESTKAGTSGTASASAAATLRQLLEARCGLLVPGAANALAALVIADLGFRAVYLTGAGLANTFLGMPDLGFVTLSELAQHTAAIRNVVTLPLIVDADTGFGNALNVRHTVQVLERAGASAIQLEDQVAPKRCGHFSGKEVTSVGEMVGKVKAAVDARSSCNFLVIARTDARAELGFQASLDRAGEYIAAGADLTFVEAPESIAELQQISQQLPAPQVVNMVVGGKTPILDAFDLAAMGFGMILYANAALQGAVLGMQNALRELKERGRLDESSASVITFAERQKLVNKPHWDELESRYAKSRS